MTNDLQGGIHKKLSPKKKERLLEANLDSALEGKFISRNLNDTRYASRSMMNFIEQYLEFPNDGAKNHVIAVSGGATGALRHAWGLRKSRSEDACHHFLDAAVIAACDRSAIQAVAKAASEKRLYDKSERGYLFSRTQPWEGFREEVEAFKEQLIPTRMIDHKLSGRIFEDSRYRFKGIDEESHKGILEKSGSESVGANFIVLEDGKTALKPDGQAFLRLWWDPEAKVRGRARPGRYLAEVVYYADLAAIRAKTYTPRYVPPVSNPCHRDMWPEVPERATTTEPLVIFRNDLLCIKGKLVRYISYHISNDSWRKLVDPKTGNEASGCGTLASIDHPDDLRIIKEDLLGECFALLRSDLEG